MTVRAGAGGTDLSGLLPSDSSQSWQIGTVLAAASILNASAAQKFINNPALLAGTVGLTAGGLRYSPASVAFGAVSSLLLPDTLRFGSLSAIFIGASSLIADSTQQATYPDPVRDWPTQVGLPPDWSQQGGQFTLTVTPDQTSNGYSDRILTASGVVTAGAITWDVPGTAADCEILTLFKVTTVLPSQDYASALVRRQ